ncbi:MAG: polyprenyl synthetase [Planctomycetes bacterium]|jgi:octaprenyl-diphosphate synthase|nr:polyprenyl synthetase [Planctomycetota bacterium]
MDAEVAPTTVLENVTAPVADELRCVSEIVEHALRPERPDLADMLAHVGSFRGKQLRPALVLLVAKALGRLTDEHLEVAAIVEMIHVATLVHDDILDGADVRRNLATINALHGPDVSVLLGDYIYAKAFWKSVSLPDQRCSRLLAEVTRVICQGEITQTMGRWDLELAEDTYFDVIGQKTAALYGASSELGAAYAGASDVVVSNMRDFGYNLGLAFQIIDDCLDVEGDEEVAGKSLGTDFGKGKLTLPFLWVLRALDESGKQRFAEIFRAGQNGHRKGDCHDTRSERLAAEFDVQGGLAYAHERADGYLRAALSSLDGLQPNAYLDGLRAMADFVLHRRK